jgi:uncharacterized protein DUF3142
MRHVARLTLFVVAALSVRTTAARVNAEDYDAFWLWAGVAPQPALERARTVYVLQGQVAARPREDGPVTVIAQGIPVARLAGPDVWIVYRAHTLHWPPSVYPTLLEQLERWRRAGNHVVGIQVDFDARASYVREYASFLRDLRGHLPLDCRLGITGLLDWSANADPVALDALAGVVDEVVVQTYQGRHTIADYRRYLPRVARLTLPFKIGLLQGGEWEEPPSLAANPSFRGYVVFLQNRPRAPDHDMR